MAFRLIRFDKEKEDGFGEPVQFVGVYALRWHDYVAWGIEPQVAFVEDTSGQELVADMTNFLLALSPWVMKSALKIVGTDDEFLSLLSNMELLVAKMQDYTRKMGLDLEA